jgi:hypothetical protein
MNLSGRDLLKITSVDWRMVIKDVLEMQVVETYTGLN